MARIGPLYNSLPCYSAPPISFKTSHHCSYDVKRKPEAVNIRTNVRYDRDYGMSAWSCPAVQQGRPYNIVDETKDMQAPAAIHWPHTEYLRIYHDPAFILPLSSACGTTERIPPARLH